MDTPEPYIVRLRTSRPNESVPNQCSEEGAFRTLNTFVSYGSAGAIKGAVMEVAIASKSIMAPVVPRGLERRNLLIALSRRAQSDLLFESGENLISCVVAILILG